MIRFQPGPIFSGNSSDYWVPLDWLNFDQHNWDQSAGPLLVDVPGATPSRLIVQMGKDRYAHLLNRDNLGGISAPIAEAQVATTSYLAGRPPTEQPKARMLLFAPAATHSRLSALLQPVHLPSPADGSVTQWHWLRVTLGHLYGRD